MELVSGYRASTKKHSPREFFGKLVKHNRELDWASFNRSNVTDVVNHLTTKYETTEGIHVQAEATQLSQPFGNSNAKLWEEWDFIQALLRAPFSAVPTPKEIRKFKSKQRKLMRHDGAEINKAVDNDGPQNIKPIEAAKSKIHLSARQPEEFDVIDTEQYEPDEPITAFKASDGSPFQLPDLSQEELESVSPCNFFAMLLEKNHGLPWCAFNKGNVTEVVDQVVDSFDLVLVSSARLLYPFDSPITEVLGSSYFPKCGSLLTVFFLKLSEEWAFIEEIMQYHLPAVPNPQNLVGIENESENQQFKFLGQLHKLPKINHVMFRADGLNTKYFLKKFILKNQDRPAFGVVSEGLLKLALTEFVQQSFWGAPKLAKGLVKQFNQSDERTMMGQYWYDILPNLGCQHAQVISKAQIRREVPAIPSDEYSAHLPRSPAYLGYVNATLPGNRPYITQPMNEPQSKLLGSENRFLSITIPKPKSIREDGEIEAVKLRVYFDVQRVAGDGFIDAIWYGWYDLIVEYGTRTQRDEALHTMTRECDGLSEKDVQPLTWSGPRICMSWIIFWHSKDTSTTLSDAIHHHFDKTNYWSFYTFGRFDRPVGYRRIIFHRAPPSVSFTLGCRTFKERRIWKALVHEKDYPLQAERIPNRSDIHSPTSTIENSKAYSSTKYTTGSNGTDEARYSTSKSQISETISVISQLTDKGLKKDHLKSETQGMPCGKPLQNDASNVNEAIATVILDGASYKVPSASALPLHKATFNDFARRYFELDPQERGTLNVKSLVRLYHAFIETLFRDAKSDAKLDAFQRIDFNKPVTNPRTGGLSLKFSMASRNAYHGEFLALSKALLAKESIISNANPSGGNSKLAGRAPVPKGHTSRSMVSRATNAKSKQAQKRPSSSPKLSSATQLGSSSSIANPQEKQQEPDILSKLEEYLDDLDARLQLERELIAEARKLEVQK